MTNVVVISGNLGEDPESRDVGDSVVTEFRIAHNEKWQSGGHTQERTSWYTVERWGDGFARVADEHLRKGTKVCVTGTISVEKWESRDGKEGTTVKIRATSVDILTWDNDGARDSRGSRDGGQRGGRDDRRNGRRRPEPLRDSDIPDF